MAKTTTKPANPTTEAANVNAEFVKEFQNDLPKEWRALSEMVTAEKAVATSERAFREKQVAFANLIPLVFKKYADDAGERLASAYYSLGGQRDKMNTTGILRKFAGYAVLVGINKDFLGVGENVWQTYLIFLESAAQSIQQGKMPEIVKPERCRFSKEKIRERIAELDGALTIKQTAKTENFSTWSGIKAKPEAEPEFDESGVVQQFAILESAEKDAREHELISLVRALSPSLRKLLVDIVNRVENEDDAVPDNAKEKTKTKRGAAA